MKREQAVSRIGLVAVLAVALTLTGWFAAAAQEEAPDARARSVILFIGDGVDEHQLTLGRNYLHGAGGQLLFETLDHRASARVLTVMEDNVEQPEYVADSASGGTALSTGVVTSRSRIATTAKTDQDIPTIMELAHAAGKRTGVVATSAITDATPASFYAHISFRFCEGPKDMTGARGGLFPPCPKDERDTGGPGSIAEQLVFSNIDVALGGGHESFEEETFEGKTVLEEATQAGMRVLTKKAELESLKPGAAERVLGLFASGHLPVRWQGEGRKRARPFDTEAKELQAPEPFGCEPSPDFQDTPDMALLTKRAIELLEGGPEADTSEGFVLMVESASIDKQAHAANPCGQIGEIEQLEEAVAVALEYQERHPDTLILVASDHGHAVQIIPWPSMFKTLGGATARAFHSPGKFAVVKTLEGGQMGVSYATSTGFYEEHTGTAVPIFAQGPGAEAVRGLMDQADVFRVMKEALGL